MQTLMKHKGKSLFILLLLLFIAIGVAAGISMLPAEAATSSAGKYLTYGSYNNGKAGYMDKYKVYMHAPSQNGTTGTIYDDKVLNWNYVYIKIEVSGINSHVSFKLTRNGSTYSSKTLSGKSNMTLYSGSLPDGDYVLTYVGKHNTFLWVTETYTYIYKFTIDKTGPVYSLKAGGSTITSGSYTNKQIEYSVTDYKTWRIYFLKPGASTYSSTSAVSYTIPATSANNGRWFFYAEDYYDNTNSTINIYLDTIKPVGTVRNSSGSTVSNGGYTNKKISYTASDTGGVKTYEYKAPTSSSWQSYTSGRQVGSSNGWYTFRAKDYAGNISDEYKVYYDASTPTGTLYGGTVSKSSGGYTNAEYVRYVANNNYSGIANCYVKMPNTSYFTSYTSGSHLTEEGKYSFYSISKAGTRSSTVTITLDKMKPVGTLYGGSNLIANGGYTNANYIRFIATDKTSMKAYVKKPGSSSFVDYTLGTQFIEEGTYSFYATDAASNRSDTYTITLSRGIPVAQLYVDGEPFDNNGYTNGSHIKFECDETCYVMLPGESSYIPYASGAEFYKPGKYVFYGISPANNHSGYYTIVIDRTEKTLIFENVLDGITSGDVVIDWEDGDPDVYAPVKTVTINGKAYEKGDTIHTIDTGEYDVYCEDAAGNVWTDNFISTKQNVLTETLQKEYYEAPDKDGNLFAFASYDSAFAFAVEREKGFVRTAEWNGEVWDTGMAMDAKDSVNAVNGIYYIYKKSGNPEEEVAYFTQERLNEVFAEYAAIGIESYYYWEKLPSTIADGENLFSYSDEKTVLANQILLDENTGFLSDGELFTGTVFETEGRHILTAFDEWGNTCDYNVIVIRRAPDIYYALGEGDGNLAVFDRVYYFKSAVTVFIEDEYDEFSMFCVYAEDESLLNCLSLGESLTLDKSGMYTVQAINHYGKSEIFTLIISIDAPETEILDKKDAKQLEIKILESMDGYADLQTLEIYKSTDGGESWILLDKDDYGTKVSLDTLIYRFRTSGMYRVVLTDAFRTGIDAVISEFEYVQADPEGTLIGVENGGFSNGEVWFEWTDEAVLTLEKDGMEIPYESGQKLSQDGHYVLTFENYDGYRVVYTFDIDTVAPEINIDGAEHNERVSADVTVEWTEENLAGKLYKNGAYVGEYISGTVLSKDGAYRIVVTDLAGNAAEVCFIIDKTADFDINVNDKGLSNSVTITGNEELTVLLTKDGEVVEYDLGDSVTEPGTYTLNVSDSLGNTREVSFIIVKPLVQSFEHNFDNVPGFEKVTVDGEDKRLNYGTLELKEDGVYEVGVVVNGVSYNFTVTVDATAPTLTIDGVENGGTTKDKVILSNLSETANVRVYRNDEAIEYELGNELREVGIYRVVVTDEAGNTSEYSFEIEKSISGGIIALIVIAVLAVVGVGVFLILKKRKKV